MSDYIDRQVAISAICNACGKIDCDKMDKCEKLQLPPANCSEFPNNSDTISRQAAIDALDKRFDSIPMEQTTGILLLRKDLRDLPSVLPERLTDDDFETIRIHLNAYKEELCNQRRWKEAGEYQRIIDRFMEFASAQPDLGKYEYHYDHTDCIWYRPEARNRCPVTCAQYRDGWNDAMNYIFRDGKGYMPYRRDKQYGE